MDEAIKGCKLSFEKVQCEGIGKLKRWSFLNYDIMSNYGSNGNQTSKKCEYNKIAIKEVRCENK